MTSDDNFRRSDHLRKKKQKQKSNWYASLGMILLLLSVLISCVIYFQKADVSTIKNLGEAKSSLESASENSSQAEQPTQTISQIEDARFAQALTQTEVAKIAQLPDIDDAADETIIGRVICPEIGLDLPIWQGMGIGDGEPSDEPTSQYQRFMKAVSVKKNQVLGRDNFVLGAHTSFFDSSDKYFNPLLSQKNDNFEENPQLENLKLHNGSVIYVKQNVDQCEYKFRVSKIVADYGQEIDGEVVFTQLNDAHNDFKNRPQLTLYACTDKLGSGRLIVQAELVGTSEID
ncbi:hypothetical protein Hs30E_03940 [Lactococcus hodotermopsidis]|uniref:Sortase n=1 Tax=Pseudolactococcus hodotermopsidis TaxID=2709157 RepID=A0A6A0BB05_9LACT|nr:sortase [Lactococcus hodotermopsidis]GFH41843.1 hypothetical protein Hs30E_03940 [Lactococcus hodotermopsidis]